MLGGKGDKNDKGVTSRRRKKKRRNESLTRCQIVEAAKAGAVEIVLTSYSLFTKYVNNNDGEIERDGLPLGGLKNVNWSCLIFDEAHCLKSSTAKVCVAAKSMRTAVKIAMTGTPMQNNLDELWRFCDNIGVFFVVCCLLFVVVVVCFGMRNLFGLATDELCPFIFSKFLNKIIPKKKPGIHIFGDSKTFKSFYKDPISVGRQRTATAVATGKGNERQRQLNTMVRSCFFFTTLKWTDILLLFFCWLCFLAVLFAFLCFLSHTHTHAHTHSLSPSLLSLSLFLAPIYSSSESCSVV